MKDSVDDPRTQPLGLAARHFALYAAALRGACGSRRTADSYRFGHAGNQGDETIERIAAIFFLAAIGLRLDNDDAILRHALVPNRQESFLYFIRQTGCVHVESQMNGAGNFVNVLAAGALRPNHGEVDVAQIELDISVYGDHDGKSTRIIPRNRVKCLFSAIRMS
jgi:hypothetical protein